MSIIFSKACEYGIQAVLFLAMKKNGSPIRLKDISSALRIPHHFLSKILQTLERDEIVISRKGLNGGFELGREPSKIHLIDVVRAIDGEAFLDHCVLGFPRCGSQNPCPVHSLWKESKEIILGMLHNNTIEALSKSLGKKIDLIEKLSPG